MRLERFASEYLLRGERALRAPAADESDDPVRQYGDAVLEAGQRVEVDGEPQQPCEEARRFNASDRRDRETARLSPWSRDPGTGTVAPSCRQQAGE